MDNYFHECPPMMDDGRLFTDYRSSQVREELFRFKNCVNSENEARTLRIDNGEEIMDDDWNKTRQTKSCFPNKVCFHKHPKTKVTTSYNNAEMLAYNGIIPAPPCYRDCFDFRMTSTKGSRTPRPGCAKGSKQSQQPYYGYPTSRQPVRIPKSNRVLPDGLYNDY